MRKILVTYYSLTGNTKKIAEAIFESLEGTKTIKPLDEVDEIESYSLIFIGFPVHSHSVPYRAEKFLQAIPRGKKIALFSTHGSHSGSRISRQALEYAVVLAARTKILGTFSCRGRVSREALKKLKKSPEHSLWAEMAASAHTHPDRDDIEDARAFARWIQALHSEERG